MVSSEQSSHTFLTIKNSAKPLIIIGCHRDLSYISHPHNRFFWSSILHSDLRLKFILCAFGCISIHLHLHTHVHMSDCECGWWFPFDKQNTEWKKIINKPHSLLIIFPEWKVSSFWAISYDGCDFIMLGACNIINTPAISVCVARFSNKLMVEEDTILK